MGWCDVLWGGVGCLTGEIDLADMLLMAGLECKLCGFGVYIMQFILYALSFLFLVHCLVFRKILSICFPIWVLAIVQSSFSLRGLLWNTKHIATLYLQVINYIYLYLFTFISYRNFTFYLTILFACTYNCSWFRVSGDRDCFGWRSSSETGFDNWLTYSEVRTHSEIL